MFLKTFLFLYTLNYFIKPALTDQKTVELNIWKWKKNCKDFRIKNEMWYSSKCHGTIPCSLTTEHRKDLKNVNEVLITMEINFMRYSSDLIAKFIRKPYMGKHSTETLVIRKASNDKYTKVLTMQNYNSLKVQFQNNGEFCGEIKRVLISYIICNKKPGLEIFPQTFAPSRNENPIVTKGKCFENATPLDDPVKQICYTNGSIKSFGKCVCAPGHYLSNKKCVKCIEGFYKAKKGNSQCKKCGVNSYSSNDSSRCDCLDGFYRLATKQNIYSSKCYSTKPRTFKLISVSDDNVEIGWDKHHHDLDVKNFLIYKIYCKNCQANEGTFPIFTTSTKTKIKNLKPNKIYFIDIIAEFEGYHGKRTESKPLEVQFTTLSEKKLELYIIIIIAVGTIFILVSCAIILCLIVNQKRTTSSFRNTINSLRRSIRPPRPPSLTESVTSEINPYAIYQAPDKDVIEEAKKQLEIYKMKSESNDEAYVYMSSGLNSEATNKKNHYVHTPKPCNKALYNTFSKPVDSTKLVNQLTERIDKPKVQTNEITFSYIEKQRELSRETYTRQRSRTTLDSRIDSIYINDWQGSGSVYDNRISVILHEDNQINDFNSSNMSIPVPRREFRQRNRSSTVLTAELPKLTDNEKSESCYMNQNFHYLQFEELKMGKHYRRAESKNNIDNSVVLKRPRSADDINRINSYV